MKAPAILFTIALVLACIGAINWGVIGATKLASKEFNLVEFIGSKTHPYVEPAVYLLVGASGLLVLGSAAAKAMKK